MNVRQFDHVIFALKTRIASWLSVSAQFAAAETASYLRDRSAIFWTFIYPVALLALMITLFGSSPMQMVIDIEGDGPMAQRISSLLGEKAEHMDGVELRVRRVSPRDKSPSNRVRLVFVEEQLHVGSSSKVLIRLQAEPDPTSGAILAMAGEAISIANLELAGAPQLVRTEYLIGSSEESITTYGSHAYYVTGLAVLTLVSTALFGFSGPLIELRAGGGFRMFQVMPIPRSAFLAGFALCRIGILLMFTLIYLAGGLSLFSAVAIDSQKIGFTVLLILVGSTAFLASGLAIAGFVTKSSTASVVINLVNLPVMFLSDLFIPVAAMAPSIQAFASWSPIYHLVSAVRLVVAGQATWSALFPCLIGLMALASCSLLVASVSFRWSVRR